MKEGGFAGLAWLFKLAGQQKGKLVSACIFSVISTVLGLAPFYIAYLIVLDLGDPEPSGYRLTLLALAVLALLVFKSCLHLCASLFSHRAAFNLLFDLRERLVTRLGSTPLGFLDQQASGRVKKVLSDDIERLELFIAHHLPDLISAVATPVSIGVFLFFMDWRLALAALAPLPLALISQAVILRGHEDKVREYHDHTERMHSAVVEYVRAMMIVKVFNQSKGAYRRYERSVKTYGTVLNGWIKTSASPLVFFKITLELGILILVPLSVWLYQLGDVNLATVLLFLLLGLGLMEPLLKITFLGGLLSQIVEGAVRINDLLHSPLLPEVNEEASVANREIEYRRVNFSYYPGKPVLRDVSFKAPEKTITAFVGPSGAGKSTAANLLIRLWDVDEGEVLLGGRDIRQMPLKQLLENISFVSQEVHIFQASVMENIRMGNQGADLEQVQHAARLAQAHDFIVQLKDGYDTVLGRGETGLSGGERQRIAIARAILKDAPVVVLDEATAYADPSAELKIQRALDSLLVGKTVIVIAHRLSTIKEVGQIVFFSQGRAAAHGRHEELLQTCPEYRQMWDAHQKARKFKLASEGLRAARSQEMAG